MSPTAAQPAEPAPAAARPTDSVSSHAATSVPSVFQEESIAPENDYTPGTTGGQGDPWQSSVDGGPNDMDVDLANDRDVDSDDALLEHANVENVPGNAKKRKHSDDNAAAANGPVKAKKARTGQSQAEEQPPEDAGLQGSPPPEDVPDVPKPAQGRGKNRGRGGRR